MVKQFLFVQKQVSTYLPTEGEIGVIIIIGVFKGH